MTTSNAIKHLNEEIKMLNQRQVLSQLNKVCPKETVYVIDSNQKRCALRDTTGKLVRMISAGVIYNADMAIDDITQNAITNRLEEIKTELKNMGGMVNYETNNNTSLEFFNSRGKASFEVSVMRHNVDFDDHTNMKQVYFEIHVMK